MGVSGKRAIVIGGSMSGLFAGLQLRKAGFAVDIYERAEGELAADRLEASIADARWQALRVRVRPDAMLAALDEIATLVRTDVPRAERLIARLADLLRLTLDASDEREAPLQHQLSLLGALLDVARASGRAPALVAEIERRLGRAELPSGLLIAMADDLLGASTSASGQLTVSARRDGDGVRLSVVHEGGGRMDSGSSGWTATREAAALARRDFDLALDLRDGEGIVVVRRLGSGAGDEAREHAEELCRSA